MFVALWAILIPYWPLEYGNWKEPYYGLLSLAILFVIFALLVPMLSFHKKMHEQKTELLINADRLSLEMTKIQNKLAGKETADEYHYLQEKLSIMHRQYYEIEQMPTWPFNLKVRLVGFLTTTIIQLLSLLTGIIRGVQIAYQ